MDKIIQILSHEKDLYALDSTGNLYVRKPRKVETVAAMFHGGVLSVGSDYEWRLVETEFNQNG